MFIQRSAVASTSDVLLYKKMDRTGLNLLILLFYAPFIKTDQGCSISVKKSFPKDNEPFLLKQNASKLDFYIPKYSNGDDIYNLNHGESFYLVCPYGKNYINITKKSIEKVICENSNLIVDGHKRNLTELTCKFDVGFFVLNTHQICARGKGTVIEIGFEAQGWHKILTICHNINSGRSYYSTHILYRDLTKGGLYKRGRFKKEARWLFKGYNPNDSYKRVNQKHVFESILEQNLTSNYINNMQFLSRGHLSPVSDFPFTTWQRYTFVYSNAAPQWQSINGGNWRNIEIIIRNNTQSNLYNVATGTHGVFKIQDKNGTMVEIYLERGKIPVPAYYWKIIHDPTDDSCIVFVSTNDPFLKSAPDKFCEDICEQNGWPVFQNKLKNGFVYCCDYSSFKKEVIDVPVFNCKNVLKFKK